MSMPLRFEPSENPAMTLPDVGQAQSSLALSISGTRADSGREVGGVAFAILAGAGAVADAEGGAVGAEGGAVGAEGGAVGATVGDEGAIAAGGGAADIGGRSNRASARSAYGKFIARRPPLEGGRLA